MAFILGEKFKMSQRFKDENRIPLTLIKAGPVVVTQLKDEKKDGYKAVQVGFGEKKRLNKPLAGHLKNLGKFKWLREFRLMPEEKCDLKPGDKIDISTFKEGDLIEVSGITKGKGFQGVVKRHGFHGGPKTHGQKNRLRAPGSIGSTAMQRVVKGRRMAGRMGGERITVKNLEIITIDPENNILEVKGAVPGRKGTLLEIRSKK